MISQDTICAIATAQGGAIGIIRVSGPQSITIVDQIFVSPSQKRLIKQPANTVHFGRIITPTREIIDEVLVSIFHSPASYTGEDSVEISCHGSSYILQQVIQLLIQKGCRIAQPGEYTQRAFLNGKMDLSQAEAVADLISSSSEASHRLAMNQMRGGFSHELSTLRNQLLHLTSLIELELDFSDHEELEFADRTELQNLTIQIETVISKLVQSFSIGNAIKNGIPVAIIGETNVGKSTLLNALLNEEKAIVSDIHGTTRDIIEDTINLAGVTFRFIDTAGIRETNDTIENLGIQRSFRALDQAQIVILMYDLQKKDSEFRIFYETIRPYLKDKQVILTMNKCDIVNNEKNIQIPSYIKDIQYSIEISAYKDIHIDKLKDLLIQIAALPEINTNDIIITNLRHYEALENALKALHRVQKGLTMNITEDLVSQDLRECLFYLNDIVGEVTTDQVLENIFKHFCIGK